jgi:hypothetical protein
VQRVEDYGLLGVPPPAAPPAYTIAMAQRMVDRSLDGIRDRSTGVVGDRSTVAGSALQPSKRQSRPSWPTLGQWERRAGGQVAVTRC